ncbi:hypothetical protein ACJX0J_037133 [Zea mays]
MTLRATTDEKTRSYNGDDSDYERLVEDEMEYNQWNPSIFAFLLRLLSLANTDFIVVSKGTSIFPNANFLIALFNNLFESINMTIGRRIITFSNRNQDSSLLNLFLFSLAQGLALPNPI